MNSRMMNLGLALVMGISVSAFAADACSLGRVNAGESHTKTANDVGSISGTAWDYELWSAEGEKTLTYYDNGTFKAEWKISQEALFHVGNIYGSTNTGIAIHTKKFSLEYNFSKEGDAPYGLIGVYGRMEQPQGEFYIVDDWYGELDESFIGPAFGEYEVDGAKYTIHAFLQENSESWTGRSTFVQFYCVRETKRQCGYVDVSAHLKKLEEVFQGQKVTLTTSRHRTMEYPVQFSGLVSQLMAMVDVGGESQGSVDFTYVRIGDLLSEESSSSAAPESSSDAESSSSVVGSSSSVAGSSASIEGPSSSTTVLSQKALVSTFDRTLMVFDLQGRILGHVHVPAGTSVNSAVLAKFGRPGSYIVK